jgi:hypothetical protein
MDSALILSRDRRRIGPSSLLPERYTRSSSKTRELTSELQLRLPPATGFASPRTTFQSPKNLAHDRRLQRPRQIDLKGRSHAWLTVGPDEPTVLLHDAIHGSQTETGALAFLFSIIERLEDV